MAIRYRKKYGTWQVYWNNPLTGKRESKSFTDKGDAEKEDSLVRHRLKFDRESFREKEIKPRDLITLEEVYLGWLCEKQITVKELEVQRCKMLYVLIHYGGKPIRQITVEDLENIKSHFLADKRLSPGTVHTRLAALRTIIYWAMQKGYMEQIRFPQIPSPQYKTFIPPTPEEILAIYNVASPHIQRCIILGAYLGIRVGACEMFGLTWDDVDLVRGVVRVHGARKNLNAMWREVPIKDTLLPLFEKWLIEDRASGSTYLIHIKCKPVGKIKHAWQNALKRAGITRRIRPYDLRHAFATELVAAGVDIGTVAKLMGHSSPMMLLKHYAYIMDSQKKNAIEALPAMPAMCREMCRTK